MNKIFLYFLKKYTKTEENRLKVFSVLKDQVEKEYIEQTKFGNVYNVFIEFIMSDKFIINLVKENNNNGIVIIRNGLNTAYNRAIKYIKNEKL